MSVRKRFGANIRKSYLPMVNLKLNMTQKLDPSLEPSNYKQLPKIRMFFAESSIFFQDFTSGGRFLFSLNIFGRT